MAEKQRAKFREKLCINEQGGDLSIDDIFYLMEMSSTDQFNNQAYSLNSMIDYENKNRR